MECIENTAHNEYQSNALFTDILSPVEGHDWSLRAHAKNGIIYVFTKAMEALMDCIQKYESHSMCKSVRNDRCTDYLPKLYQEAEEKHSQSCNTVYKIGSSEYEIEHDTLFSGRFNTSRYDLSIAVDHRNFEIIYQDQVMIPAIIDKNDNQSVLIV